jgi:transcriptional regulator
VPKPLNPDAVRGTIDLLILKALLPAPMHGWGIGQRIEQASGGEILVNQGSLYPALQRLEHAGLITSDWSDSENGRRARYYRLTAAGRAAIKTEVTRWRRYIAAVELMLEAP